MGLFSFVGDVLGDITGANDAADDVREATAQNIAQQEKGLQYLKDVQAIPLQYRDQALSELGGFYGLGGGPSSSALIDRVKSGPMYSSMIDQGRQAVGQTLSATGGLRGGIGPQSFMQQDQNVLNNLVNQQLQGLQGFAQQPINAGQVAQQYGNIGNTMAQGQIGAAQTKQAGIGQGLGLATGLAGLFI